MHMAWTPVVVDGAYIVSLGAMLVAINWMIEPADEFSSSLLVLFLILGIFWLLCWLRELVSLRVQLKLQLLRRAELKSMIVFALPLVPAGLVGYLAEWVDYFLLKHFLGDHAVGLFHPAFQYMLVLLGLPSALVAVLLPKLVDAVESSDEYALKRLMRVRLLQYLYVWCFFSLPLSGCLPWILEWLLGAEFQQASSLIKIMLLVLPGAVVQHIGMTLCLLQGRLAFATIFLFSIKLLINAVVSLLLIERFGLVGAAIGMVVGYLALHWMLLVDQLKRFGIALCSDLSRGLLFCQFLALMLVCLDGLWLRMGAALLGMTLVLYVVRMWRIITRGEAEAFFAFSGFCAPFLAWLVSKK